MQKKPSNTREQCAFDSGAAMRRKFKRDGGNGENGIPLNPHKKGSPEHQFWNEGFDNA